MICLFRTVFVAILLAGCLSGHAIAQIVFGDPPMATARFVLQSWTIDNDITGQKRDLTQWYFPVWGFIPIAESWELHVSSASAATQSDSAGTDVSITGLNDTRVSVLHSLLDNRLLLGAGLNLPTGKSTLDADQSGLGQLLTSEFLNLPSKLYGEGFGLYLETAYSEQIERMMFGVGAGILINGSYSPTEDIESYNPGNRFTVAANAAYRHNLGTAYGYFRHNYFATSTQDGSDIYKIGGITQVMMGSSFDYQQFDVDIGFRLLFRGADSRLMSNELVEYEENNYGSDVRIFSNFGYRLERIGKPVLLVDYKRVGGNGFEPGDQVYVGKSNLFGIGAGFEKTVAERFDLSATVTTYSGSAEDGDLDLSGIEVSLSGRATF